MECTKLLSPNLFNIIAEYIMGNVAVQYKKYKLTWQLLRETLATSDVLIKSLWQPKQTQNLRNFLLKVIEESVKTVLLDQTKITNKKLRSHQLAMPSQHKQVEKKLELVTATIFVSQKCVRDGHLHPRDKEMFAAWEKVYDRSRENMRVQIHQTDNKDIYYQSYRGFSFLKCNFIKWKTKRIKDKQANRKRFEENQK